MLTNLITLDILFFVILLLLLLSLLVLYTYLFIESLLKQVFKTL